MEYNDLIKRIAELEREIAALPRGTVSPKTVRGKIYYYHRYSLNGTRYENCLDIATAKELEKQIEKRKALEAELKELKVLLPKPKRSREKTPQDQPKFKTYVRIGEQLLAFASHAENYKKRKCYSRLSDYVFGERQDKVFVLYGLRRTGKTTLIRQAILDLNAQERENAAFIQIKATDRLSDVNSDLQYLEKKGYKYIFIDEVTLIEDFIEGAALFSDIYASSGMKIVLSGTDSLGFLFTKSEQLYDRCIVLHTTFIPYKEFESVLGIYGVDEFIRYGGTMSMGGVNYNKTSSFATKEMADEYVDSAIARNIQHSLRLYQDGGHFRHLYDLYARGELTSAINRVVEDMNHRFAKQTLISTFTSNDLSLTARNLLNDRSELFDLFENIDREKVVGLIKDMLEILNNEEQTVEIDDTHIYQIREYLTLLDMVMEVGVIHFPNVREREKKVVISQPGLRYAQAKALVESLMLDEKFNDLSAIERSRITERALGAIKGRMIEDLILLETKLANPTKEVFQLQFAVGEFDMVIHDPETLTCEIYEIKLSREIIPNQYRHLIDKDKCEQTEHRFGKIVGKYVIYRGEPAESEGIHYLKVEDYLNSLNHE